MKYSSLQVEVNLKDVLLKLWYSRSTYSNVELDKKCKICKHTRLD